MKRKYKKWNDYEENKLKELVGTTSLHVIARRLERTEGGIERKLEKLGIYPRESRPDITAYQLATLLNVDSHTVLRWINKHGLPHTRKVTKFQRENIFICPEKFWKWAEMNKQRINFAKIPRHALPPEPEWVEQQRKIDREKIPSRHQQNWTPQEDQILLSMAAKGVYQKDIGLALNRPTRGVQKRLKLLRQKLEQKQQMT
jgi:hypothetical protein